MSFFDMLNVDQPLGMDSYDSDTQRVLSSIDEAEDLLGVSQAPTQYIAASPDIDKKILQLIDMTALG